MKARVFSWTTAQRPVRNSIATLEPLPCFNTIIALIKKREDFCTRIVDAYKGYAGYAEKTDRDIPVVICEPRST